MTCTRRRLIENAARASLLAPMTLAAPLKAQAPQNKLAIPGLFPGRVIAVEDRRSLSGGRYNAEFIRGMMRKGMQELTGLDWAESWKLFVQKGERVGIKVNPVGQPHCISAPPVLHEIIDGLKAAGIRAQDIVVYDRYRRQFHRAGFHQWLPEGVRKSAAVEDYDDIQLDIQGYDRDHYVELPLTLPGYANDERARRSHAALFITKEVDKLINLCVLKDHQSAGVTLALKNLSHGLVNNVSRSHSSKSLNACNTFIPAVVQMPVIRNKAVLHILDGVKGVYHGGPGARPEFVWEHYTMYFATDPVALDHVGWRKIDEKRVAVGKKVLVEDTPDKFSTFVHRQPEHVEIAGALGLGVWPWEKITYRHIQLG
ncbi:MAG: DUF362 domain-containing protein [Bryobacteraceae bacterium]|nr:DUF362 domain-containing protein [Bryobacteraceae bacterium]MDW8380142.1 DUF362 domain-containing protein [Bryobacterales bacterium]